MRSFAMNQREAIHFLHAMRFQIGQESLVRQRQLV